MIMILRYFREYSCQNQYIAIITIQSPLDGGPISMK